jgi:hypothetical protein
MVVVFMGAVLQLILVWADCGDTPSKVALKFAKAYYRLDPSMSELLCRETMDTSEGNVVQKFIQRASKEAADRGFGQNYMKHILYNIETHTHRIDDGTAEVKITGKRRRSINPVYALIAKFFLIGETYKVNETITVVKEEGSWKVCGNPLSLPGI